MPERVTVTQASAMVGVSGEHITSLCRLGALPSASKVKPPLGGRLLWMLDPEELRGALSSRPVGTASASRPWSPAYRRAKHSEPTDTQYSVLAGERWHELLDMRLREDGSLWTKWSDGERFVILPNGELDEFQYVRIGEKYREYIRQAEDAADLRETQQGIVYAGAW